MRWLRGLLENQRHPEPAEWPAVLRRRFPYFTFLDAEEQDGLLERTRRFLDRANFEGAYGRQVDDEKRLVIAAQACLLCLGWDDGPLFPTLRVIIVYPGVYRADETVQQPEGTEIRQRVTRSGESWSHGTVLLSWQDVRHGARDPLDGYNVVWHEFAHQLDEETGQTNGAPALEDRRAYEEWQSVWSKAYTELETALARGQPPPILNDYAAESPAEFFAVATEWFFERPFDLHSSAPELYAQLRSFYRQDPRRYVANAG